MAQSNSNQKRYYSISEVSRMTGLEAYVLRYWEKEFPVLRPRKNRGGTRMYTTKDIELVNRIKYLRTREKLTIAGARTKLMMRKSASHKEEITIRAKARTLIGQIRKDIEDLLRFFP